MTKPLHKMYHRHIEEIPDIKKSYQWIEKACLEASTEAMIIVAQEQSLNTRSRRLPQLTGSKLPTVQGCPGGYPAHTSIT